MQATASRVAGQTEGEGVGWIHPGLSRARPTTKLRPGCFVRHPESFRYPRSRSIRRLFPDPYRKSGRAARVTCGVASRLEMRQTRGVNGVG